MFTDALESVKMPPNTNAMHKRPRLTLPEPINMPSIYLHETHLYTPKPTMTEAVLVIAALLLPIPNMLLLARTAASFALSCEWPETYVNAPRPMKVALPVTNY